MELLGIFSLFHLGIILPIFLLATILPILAIIDILRSEFEGNNKIIWVLIVVFMHIIGSILYFILGRNQKIR